MDDWKLKPARDLGMSPVERYRSYQRESGLVSHTTRFLWWSLVRGCLAGVNRLRVLGRENLPAQPSFVLVANHSSHLDALILGASLPLKHRDCLFPLAAGDVFFETPALAAFSAVVLNAMPVWRKNCGRTPLPICGAPGERTVRLHPVSRRQPLARRHNASLQTGAGHDDCRDERPCRPLLRARCI